MTKSRSLEKESNEIDFLQDDWSEMTLGRRIALSLMNYKWYNPRAGEDDLNEGKNTEESALDVPVDPAKDEDNAFEQASIQNPSLEKAWAYFEHVALDRYIVQDKQKSTRSKCSRIIRKFQKGNKKLEKAEPGENNNKTALYSPLWTPHAQLGDFGIGLGIYFATLRALVVITFVLGMVSVYNIYYFASDAYMPASFRDQISNKLTIGSAICKDTPWVPCPSCNCTSPYESRAAPKSNELHFNRCGEIVNDAGETLRVALKNDCDGTPSQLGAVNYITVILMLVSTILLDGYLRRQEVVFDEDEQTAQDYSLRVTNPPPDATDPEEWRRFFMENCDGAQVTVRLFYICGFCFLFGLHSHLGHVLHVRSARWLLTMICWSVPS